MIRSQLEFDLQVHILPEIYNLGLDNNKSEEEMNRFRYYWRLMDFYLDCLSAGLNEISWKHLIENGKFCEHDFKDDRFKKLLSEAGYNSFEEAVKIYDNKLKEKYNMEKL